MANRYSVLFEFLDYLNSHSIFKFEGKIKIIAVTYSYLYQGTLVEWEGTVQMTSLLRQVVLQIRKGKI
jgi:hypothetical protein